MTTRKIIIAVHGPLDDMVPDVPGLVAYSVHRSHPDEPTQQPADIGGVAMVWVDDDGRIDPASWFDTPVDAYLVDERVQIDWTRDWPDGTPTPAIEQIPFVRKLPELTRAQFAAHWSDKHTLLVPIHHPGVARYVQNVVVERLTPEAPEFDGVAQLYFRTAHDLHERYYDSDEGQKVVFEDVARFLDRGNGWRMIAQETWLAS
jgi:uncharacterized protein (TIGR02118 family)